MLLTGQTERLIVDKTGLAGKYDWTLRWAPESRSPLAGGNGASSANCELPPLFTALREQLSLELQPQKAPA